MRIRLVALGLVLVATTWWLANSPRKQLPTAATTDHAPGPTSLTAEPAPLATAREPAPVQERSLTLLDVVDQSPLVDVAVQPRTIAATSGPSRSNAQGQILGLEPGWYSFTSATHGEGHLQVEDAPRTQIRKLARVGKAIVDIAVLQAVPAAEDVTLLLASAPPDEPSVLRSHRTVLRIAGPARTQISATAGTWTVHWTGADTAVSPSKITLRVDPPAPVWVLGPMTRPADRLAGRIQDASGQPCAGVEVRTRGVVIQSTTDADGRFVLDALPISPDIVTLDVAIGASTWRARRGVGPFPWGDTGIEIVLQPPRQIWLRDAELGRNRPLRAMTRAQRRSARNAMPPWVELSAAATAGHLLIPEDHDERDWLQLVIEEQREFRRLRDLEVVGQDATAVVLGLRLPELRDLQIQVVDALGQGIADATVEVIESPSGKTAALATTASIDAAPTFDPSVPQFGPGLCRIVALTTTNSLGEARLSVAPRPNLLVRARAAGRAAAGEELPAGNRVVLTLRGAHQLTGTIRGTTGRVTIVARAMFGDGQASRYCLREQPGAYAIQDLVDGRYELVVRWSDAIDTAWPMGACTIRGADQHVDLDVANVATGIAIATRAPNGLSPTIDDRISVFHEVTADHRIAVATLRVGGLDELWRTRLPVGSYRIVWNRHLRGATAKIEATGTFLIHADQATTWPLEFVEQTAVLLVRSQSTGQPAPRRWFRTGNGELVRSDAGGAVRLTGLSGGRFTLQPLSATPEGLIDDGDRLGPLPIETDVVWLPR